MALAVPKAALVDIAQLEQHGFGAFLHSIVGDRHCKALARLAGVKGQLARCQRVVTASRCRPTGSDRVIHRYRIGNGNIQVDVTVAEPAFSLTL